MDDERITIAAEPADSDQGRALLAEMEAEVEALYAGREEANPLTSVVADLLPPDGALLIVRAGGEPIACAGIRRWDGSTGEIKRVYVRPGFRGRGVGRQLMAAVEEHAAQLGYRRIRLDTGREQEAARRIYESSGYRSIERYNEAPFATYWFEKDLPPAPP